jgi:hypothetical protein
MPDRVSIREDLQIIRVDSWGSVTERDMRTTLQAVVGLEQERGLRRVFIDARRVESLPSSIPLYGLATEVGLALGGIRVALIASDEIESEARYLERVVSGKGAQFIVFESEEDALAWLLREPDKRAGATIG